MITRYLKGKVLAMIDAANLESSIKSLGWWIDYLKLRDLYRNSARSRFSAKIKEK